MRYKNTRIYKKMDWKVWIFRKKVKWTNKGREYRNVGKEIANTFNSHFTMSLTLISIDR